MTFVAGPKPMRAKSPPVRAIPADPNGFGILKKKRVLYQHRTQATCAEGEHIRGVVAAFRSLGHEIQLVEPPSVNSEKSDTFTKDGAKPEQRGIFRRLISSLASGVPEIVFELCELGYNLWETPRLFWRAWRMHPDLLYVRYSLFTIAPALVSRVLKIPLVLEINDATFITRSRPLAMRRTARRMEGYIFRSASFCVTISHQFAKLACDELHLDRRKFVVLPNAVTPERFAPAPNNSRNANPILGVVGAFVPWHGLDFLVEAVARLHASHPEIRVLLVGDGPIRAEVEAEVKRLGLDEVIQFTGFIPPAQIPQFLRKMDICIIPDSNSHGSPMKLFEYMAMGKATLSPRYSPIVEVIEDAETGLLFAPRNLDDFCRQAERLLRDPVLAQKIGRQARQVVLEKHTWEVNVRTLLSELQRQSARPAGGG